MSPSRSSVVLRSGEMPLRLEQLDEHLSDCRLCMHRCGVDRRAGERGICGAGVDLEVATSCIHQGEEPVLTGDRGVGNIFLGRCSLSCIYCQNWTISQPEGESPSEWSWTSEKLARRLLQFQAGGCPSVGFVTPTHFAPQLVRVAADAVERGLRLPLIWNSSGYDSPELLRLLDGMVDIYLPDFRYWDEENAEKYSSAPGYPEHSRISLKEMYRQVGPLVTDDRGVAVRGLIVRLLVLPNGVSGTEDTLRHIADELGTDVFISLMSQYHPCYLADDRHYPLLSRGLRPTEYDRVVETMLELGFTNGWTQDPVTSPEHYLGPFQGRR